MKKRPQQNMGWILALHSLWIVTVLGMVAWWGSLLYQQAARIQNLEQQLGIEPDLGFPTWIQNQRMIASELAAFFALVIILSAVLVSLLWRDARRRRGLQAFFASMTHELRTPLTGIRLHSERLGDLAENDQMRRLVERLLDDASRMENQVDRTLELARLEGGGPVFPSSIDVNRELRTLIGRMPFQENLIVVNNLDGPFHISADPGSLEIILKNLFENAVQHAGQLPVTLTIDREKNQDGLPVLKIKDDGQGVKEISRLGQLFAKGPQSRGSGIGLYLVTSLMKKMGGSAAFSSADGFEVSLTFQSPAPEGDS